MVFIEGTVKIKMILYKKGHFPNLESYYKMGLLWGREGDFHRGDFSIFRF